MNLQLERKYTGMQSTRINPGTQLPSDHIFSSVVRELRWAQGGGWCGEREAQAQLLTCSRSDSQTLNLVKVIERER